MLPGAEIQDTINEERGGTLYATAFASFYFLLDAGERALFGHLTCVLLHIQANRFGKLLEVSIRQGMLVVEA